MIRSSWPLSSVADPVRTLLFPQILPVTQALALPVKPPLYISSAHGPALQRHLPNWTPSPSPSCLGKAEIDGPHITHCSPCHLPLPVCPGQMRGTGMGWGMEWTPPHPPPPQAWCSYGTAGAGKPVTAKAAELRMRGAHGNCRQTDGAGTCHR